MTEIKALNNNFKRLKLDVQIVKTVSNNLLKQPGNTERKCKTNVHYMPRECEDVTCKPK